MTTSQASRTYGIPYNSLLMYVRGKYGKSLKLDKLKETTPAAKDNLNTIGNSRTTPKEKAAKIGDGVKTGLGKQSPLKKVKLGKEKRLRNVSSSSSLGYSPFDLANFSHFGGGEQMGGLLMVPPPPDSRIKEILNQMHNQQAALDHSERLKELEKQLGPEQAKMLLPFFDAQAAADMIGQFSPEDGRDPSALAAAAALARDMMSSDSRGSSPYQTQKEGSDDAEMTSDIDVDHSDDDGSIDRSSNSTHPLDVGKKQNDENENATASDDGELKRMQEPLTVSIPTRGNEIPA
jgi:hypothetical protein